jgi:GNAT superfamily N-acetyltransferase
MDIDLRSITTLEAAQPHLDQLNTAAQSHLDALGSPAPPEGFLSACLQRSLSTDQGLLVVAESTPGTANLGFCLIGPQEDPLSGLRVPMILILSVDHSARHRGLAGALIQESRRLLARRGLTALSARCAHGDDALVSMGERWGFIREIELFVKD